MPSSRRSLSSFASEEGGMHMSPFRTAPPSSMQCSDPVPEPPCPCLQASSHLTRRYPSSSLIPVRFVLSSHSLRYKELGFPKMWRILERKYERKAGRNDREAGEQAAAATGRHAGADERAPLLSSGAAGTGAKEPSSQSTSMFSVLIFFGLLVVLIMCVRC